LSVSNKKQTLFLSDNSYSKLPVKQLAVTDDNICRASAEAGHIIIEMSSVAYEKLQYLVELRKAAPLASLILLTDYVYIPMAVKLKERAIIDNFVILPLSDDELYSFLNDPQSPPWNNENTLQKRIRELEKTAFTDELTGLWNRRFVDIFLANINKDIFGVDIDMSFMLFDIDELKHYNDKYGHQAGDQLIIDAAAAMRKSFRKYDLAARIGGDEFCVILWQLPAEFSIFKSDDKKRKTSVIYPSISTQIAQRLQANIAQTAITEKITLSGSITDIKNNIERLSDILVEADKKLYKAKQNGKNIILR
jgi:diguanylate cyclase (GGDEF)-like protein